jgi:hypothetical protein
MKRAFMRSTGNKAIASIIGTAVWCSTVGLLQAGQNQGTEQTQPAVAPQSVCANDSVAIREILREIAALRRDLLESKVEAQQLRASTAEKTLSDLEAERQSLSVQERESLEQISRLDAQMTATTPSPEERAILETQKATLSGPELDRLHGRQNEIDQRASGVRQTLAIEQQKVRELQQRLTQVPAAN